MKALALILSLALAGSVFGQAVHRNFGSVVFPGGTATSSPAVQRNFGSIVFPGGSQMQPVTAGAPVAGMRPGVGVGVGAGSILVTGRSQGVVNGRRTGTGGRGTRSAQPFVYAYPVYIGGGYDSSYATQEPAPQQVTPVMIQAGPDGGYTTFMPRPNANIYEVPRTSDSAAAPAPEPAADSNRYLLAFKDHTIYSAVAYWADGDTLHYFTTGNVHNQVSMSLIDRDLTERLNRELGIDFKLPAAK